MKLSKTLMINAELLPSNRKAFTLAEVLITLSILGVVAALTIPSLVNRNSDIAAQTKLKKAIAAYETAAGTYMAESGKADTALFMRNASNDNTCTAAASRFKIVAEGENNCQFTTSDGAFWVFNPSSGYAVVYDTDNAPRYGVLMWTYDGNVNTKKFDTASSGAAFEEGGKTYENKILNNAPAENTIKTIDKKTFTAPVHGYYSAAEFLKTNSTNLSKGKLSNGTDSSRTINGVTLFKEEKKS